MCDVERDTTYATKTKQVYLFFHCDNVEIDPLETSIKAMMLLRSKIHSI